MQLVDRLRRWYRDLTDDPMHDPRPEDANCPECHRLRQECLALEQRLGEEQEKRRELEVGDRPTAFYEALPEPLTIGTREPGYVRASEATKWRRGEGWDSPQLREATEHNRRRVPTNDKLAARFDLATQAAREIGEESGD